jgi:hypothetical protein
MLSRTIHCSWNTWFPSSGLCFCIHCLQPCLLFRILTNLTHNKHLIIMSFALWLSTIMSFARVVCTFLITKISCWQYCRTWS